MKIKTAYSKKTNVQDAVNELKEQLGAADGKIVLYFASSAYDPSKLAGEMTAAFPNIAAIGCTTVGEIFSGLMLKGSVVAMCMGADAVEDFEVATLKKIK